MKVDTFRKNFKNLRIIFLFIITLFVISCKDNSTTPGLKTFEANVQQTLMHMVDTMLTDRGIPGAIIWVEKSGYEPFVYAGGYSDSVNKIKMKPTDRFLIGSISKTFLVGALLQLVDNGQLDLDKKFVDYVPGVLKIKDIEKVTVRQMLNHTSGMGNYLNQYFVPLAFQNRSTKCDRSRLIDSLNDDKLYFTPGDTVEYSNSAYIALGLLLEKITGQPVEDEVQSLYIDKLGLKNSFFPKDLGATNLYLNQNSHGYAIWTDGKFYDVTSFEPSWTWTAGAVISNMYDLRTHLEEMLNGRLLKTPGLQQQRMVFHQTTLPSYGSISFGLGIANIGGKYIGHSGGWIGFNTNIYHRVDKDAYIMTFVNRYSGGENPAYDLFVYVNNIVFNENNVPMIKTNQFGEAKYSLSKK